MKSIIDILCQLIAAIEVVSSKPSNSSAGVVSSASGKTKCPNTKWTVSKKSKYDSFCGICVKCI